MTLAFSSYHLRPDPELHDAAYGARLLWGEIREGGKGVVYDRQDASGPKEVVEQKIFPVLDAAYPLIRTWMGSSYSRSTTDDVFEYHENGVTIVASPQGSGGYLYLTAVHEIAEHE